jgi:lipocalin
MDKQEQSNELYPVLAAGQFYRIKDSEKIKVTERCVKFTGVETYKGEKRWNFYDSKTGLHHWLNPNSVEPCS